MIARVEIELCIPFAETTAQLDRAGPGARKQAAIVLIIDAELKRRIAVGQSEAMLYETPGRKLGLISRILVHDLPLNYRNMQKNLMRETDRETLNQLAAKLLQPENVAIIVVGDVATLRPELEQLHWPIKILDVDANEVVE